MRVWLKQKNSLDMSIGDTAWLAGFFDGEGSLLMYKRKDKPNSYRISFSVVNTHLPSLEKCKNITGVGSIKPRKKYVSTHKDKWTWKITAQRDIDHITRQIYPYLTCKQEAAKNFLELWQDI